MYIFYIIENNVTPPINSVFFKAQVHVYVHILCSFIVLLRIIVNLKMSHCQSFQADNVLIVLHKYSELISKLNYLVRKADHGSLSS